MQIKFRTALDQYSGYDFPQFYTEYSDWIHNTSEHIFGVPVPRTGDFIYVRKYVESKFTSKNLPIRLEVTRVSYYEDYIEVELWYNKTDL